MKKRKIIHIDMDAFYASIEQRDNPSLKGKPLVVGGSPHGRGVVSTCSYEARKYGIHSAMPCKEAYIRCPYAVFVRPRFYVYKEVSNQIRNIFHRYTDLVEPLSLDEAFLDVTENKKKIKSATIIAKLIKEDIKRETGLTASAGVSYNKFVAKLASDYQKPNGLTVITEDNVQEFLDALPVKKFFGVGKVTERVLKNNGINTGYDLRNTSLEKLEKIFKNRGLELYNFARGIDNRPVNPTRIRKSIGAETTLIENKNIDDAETVMILDELCEEVAERMAKEDKVAKTITLKIKFEDFKTITRSLSVSDYIRNYDDIRFYAAELLTHVEDSTKTIRLFGVTVSNLEKEEEIFEEITLFDYID
ncbi:DNA polymerase IV [Peptacetobacter sp.]|uniref:DNA polymerase IV n=1 Tax=unclassified Peptacetobacter TaxID=2991974 RepID=UPI002621F7EC|nr:DNA polymerase IV [Peptacetobacter sp.]MEE0451230.1 DNA polymerase IV [Peptacetobacter sp.]